MRELYLVISYGQVFVVRGLTRTEPKKCQHRSTEREYSSKPLKHRTVEHILVFKR